MNQKVKPFFLCVAMLTCACLSAMQPSTQGNSSSKTNSGVARAVTASSANKVSTAYAPTISSLNKTRAARTVPTSSANKTSTVRTVTASSANKVSTAYASSTISSLNRTRAVPRVVAPIVIKISWVPAAAPRIRRKASSRIYPPGAYLGRADNPYAAGPIAVDPIVNKESADRAAAVKQRAEDKESAAKAAAFMKRVKAYNYYFDIENWEREGVFKDGRYWMKEMTRDEVVEAIKNNHFDAQFLNMALDPRAQDYYLLEYILVNNKKAVERIQADKRYIFAAKSAPIAQLLMDHGAPTGKCDNMRTLLHAACSVTRPSDLLKHYVTTTKLKVDATYEGFHVTPLHELFESDDSCKHLNPEQGREVQRKLKILLDAGADFHIKDRRARIVGREITALDKVKEVLDDYRSHTNTQWPDMEIWTSMNSCSTSPGGTDLCTYSILAAQLIAAMKKQDEARGIKASTSDIITDDNSTALHTWFEGMLVSCRLAPERECKVDELTYLLETGVNCLLKNKEGNTALDLLEKKGFEPDFHDSDDDLDDFGNPYQSAKDSTVRFNTLMKTGEYFDIKEKLLQAMKKAQESQMISMAQKTS